MSREFSAASDEDDPADRDTLRRRRRRTPVTTAILARLARRSRGFSFVRLSGGHGR